MDEKLIAKFQGSWAQGPAMYETVLYAHMKTFRQDPAIIVLHLAICTATAFPLIYSFTGNCAASAPISTFMCL